MIGSSNKFIFVAEVTTSEELLKLLGAELAITPVLCCVRGIPWTDIRADVQVLVDIIEKYFFG